MTQAQFSVVIPVRNRGELVRRAVQSVWRQTDRRAQVVIVDDGSTDETRAALDRLAQEDARLCVLHESHRGAAAARNCGAEAALADYVVFLDSDDELSPDALQAFASACAEDVAVVCGAALSVDSRGNITAVIRPRNLGAAYEHQRGLFLAGTFAVRKDVFLSVGGFAAQCRSSQHTEFALRLIPFLTRQGLRLVAIDKPTVRVHTHEQGHLRGDLSNLLAGAQYIIDNHEQQLRKSARHFADWCTIAAVYAAKLHQFSVARQLIWQSLKARPVRLVNYVRLALTLAPPVARRVWRPETIR